MNGRKPNLIAYIHMRYLHIIAYIHKKILLKKGPDDLFMCHPELRKGVGAWGF